MQTVSSNFQMELDKGLGNPRQFLSVYELYDYDATPGANGFDPDDAIERFAAEEITWNGFAYRREVKVRSDIEKSIREKLNSVTITFSNVDRYMATFAQSQQMEGLIGVIRCISPNVTDDSVVLFTGKCGRPGDVDKGEFSITLEQYFGDINALLPPHRFEPDDPDGRLPSDPLYEGIPFTAIGGSNTFTERVPSTSFLGRLFGRSKNETRYKQWSSVDETPFGKPIREIFGRCQVEVIPFRWADKGTHVGILGAISRGPVAAITNIKSRTEGLSDPVCNFGNPPAPAAVHLGDPGGTGTNNGNTCQADLAQGLYFSKLAYIEGAAIGWQNGQIVPLGINADDSPPVWTAIVKGKKIPVPDSGGDFDTDDWSDNPVAILRYVLTDPRWMNIDPAFIDDEVAFETFLHCNEPIIDMGNTQIIVVQAGDLAAAGVSFFRYRQSGLYRSRYFLFNDLGDTSIEPELEDGPYIGIDREDPLPDPSDPTDPTYLEQKPLIKRYTLNIPINDEAKATDFINKTVLPTFKGFLRVGKNGKIQIRSEQAADATRLRTATAYGATSIPVLDVTPWKTGPELLKGRILLGFGLTTSEVRTPSAAVYSTSGNSITLVANDTGTITATRSGATLSGGSTTVQASGTITIGGTPASGDTVEAVIDGISVSYILDADDTVESTAAMLAYYINANQRLKRYIRATWAGTAVVTITCLHGALTVPALLKAHTTALADPTTAPTAAGSSGGSLPAGDYYLAYADTNAIGSTVLTSVATVTVTANQKIDVSSLPALVGTGRDFYLSEKAGSTNLRYVTSRTNASNFSISDVPEPGAALPPTWNTTAEELLRIAMSFATNSQDVFPSWKASRAVTLNDVYLPTTPNGHKYQVSTGGTTGSSEPTWPTTSGGTVASGTAVFTEIGSTVLAQAGLTRANIIKDSLKWPLGSRQSSVNQIKGEFCSAKDDFARTPFRVTDRVHVAKVKKTYPMEIDLSGVDNQNQMERIANFNLSKYVEGNWFATWGTSAAGLVLEEGDVVCFSDDSGGLVNQVVRIEDLSINSAHEVYIRQARKYSTQMFSDDVGAHVIPIPSTLRFAATKDTIADVIDTIAIKDSQAIVPGLIIAPSHDLDEEGDWRGYSVHADFGDGYKDLNANGDTPNVVGTATTVLGAVSDTSVLDEVNEADVSLDFEDASFSDATLEELAANPYRNLFKWGNEYIQACDITSNGSRSYTLGGGLLRGRFETEDEVAHGASERVVYIRGSEKFVEIPVSKAGTTFNLKVVTTNQDVADATAIPVTWYANNVRPRKVSDIVLVRDASNYWLIQCVLHPRPIELPAEGIVEIWEDHTRNDPNKLKRSLPLTEGTTHACLLDSDGTTTTDEFGEVIYYESSHTDKNNFVAVISDASCQTLETLTSTFTRFDFTFTVDNDSSVVASGDVISAGLQFDPDFDTGSRSPTPSECPVLVVWEAINSGTDIQETVYSYGVAVSTPRTFPWDSDGLSIRYSTVLAGTEYRVYAEYSPGAGQVPLAIIPAPSGGFPFPLRLKMQLTGSTTAHVDNVVSGGALRPSTIYAEREQLEDFGVVQEVLFLRIYQKARYEGIGNPVDV